MINTEKMDLPDLRGMQGHKGHRGPEKTKRTAQEGPIAKPRKYSRLG
jgi:hypothetical protein